MESKSVIEVIVINMYLEISFEAKINNYFNHIVFSLKLKANRKKLRMIIRRQKW